MSLRRPDGFTRRSRPCRDATVLELLAAERASVSSVDQPDQGWKVHVADSLTGLEVQELRGAARIADIGAGAGFPGLPLAVALPAARVDLIESVGRKCAVHRAGDRGGGDRQRERAQRPLGGVGGRGGGPRGI